MGQNLVSIGAEVLSFGSFGAIGPGFGPGILGFIFDLANGSSRPITIITVLNLRFLLVLYFLIFNEIHRVVIDRVRHKGNKGV